MELLSLGELAADAASFLIIALVLAAHPRAPDHAPRTPAVEESEFQGGLAFARSNPLVRLLLIGEGLALIFFTLIIPIEVIYVRESLESTSAGFGLLGGRLRGAGIVLGSLLYLVVKSRRPCRA